MNRFIITLSLKCFLVANSLTLFSQYGPTYPTFRNLSQYPEYASYMAVIEEFWVLKNHDRVIHKLDSLANLSIEANSFKQSLFLRNEASQFCIMKSRNQEGYEKLNLAMKQFSLHEDTVNIEYAFSLQLLATLKGRLNSEGADLEYLYQNRISILENLGVDGIPYTFALTDYGFYLLNKDFSRSIDVLLPARASALANGSITNMAGVDYALISRILSPDFQETAIEVLLSDLELLSQSSPSVSVRYYMAYFNYLLGDKYYNLHSKDYDKIIHHNKAALSGLDSLVYPTWDLKAAIHSMLAYCYSELNQSNEFWQSFSLAKAIIDQQSLTSINRALVMSNLADAALVFSPDSTRILIERIKSEPSYNTHIERFVEIEARYLEATNQYDKTIEFLTNFFPQKKNIGDYTVPLFTDSIDYMHQFSYLSRLQYCFMQLEGIGEGKNYREHIIHLVNQQQQAYLSVLTKDVVGNEPTLISKEYSNFIFKSLPYLISLNDNTLDDVISSMFITSKAMQLTSNLLKNASQSSLESSPELTRLLTLNSEIQVVKSKLYQADARLEDKITLTGRLSNLLIDMLVQKYKISLEPIKGFELPLIPSLSQVQSKLKDDHALIEYCVNDTLLIFTVITSQKVMNYAHRIDNLSSILRAELRSVKTGGKPGELSNYLLSQIENELNDMKFLTVIPDNHLYQIPFEWLVLPTSGEKLIDKITISYNYSTVLWYNQINNYNAPESMSILLVAPIFPDEIEVPITFADTYTRNVSLSSLFHSGSEVEVINSMFSNSRISTKLLVKDNATEHNLKRHISNHTILHIASHSETNNQKPEASGIFLYRDLSPNDSHAGEDNFLTLGELYSLNLSTDLVVLSSCKSGIGEAVEGEGVFALPRGMLYAGAKNVIASLWKVHDEKTKDLMVAFYQNLLEGNTYAEALRLAKLDCIAKGFLPLDWAGFVLIGS